MIEKYPNSTIAFFLLNTFYFLYCQKLKKHKCDFNETTKLQRKLRIEFRP